MENETKKKSIFKKWWFWVIVVIVVIGIAGINGNNNQPSKVGESKSASSSGSTKSGNTDTPKSKIFKIGDIVQLTDYKITVNKIRTNNGGDMIKPKDGNVFLYVDCTIENISKEQKAVSSVMMFKVQDQDGRSFDQAIPEKQNGQLDGNVSAGQKISGEYVVEVPKDKVGLKLVFDSTLVGGSQVLVQLN